MRLLAVVILALAPLLSHAAGASQSATASAEGCAVNIQGNNNIVRCRGYALIPCSDVDYSNPRYHENMDVLARESGLPDEYYSRYHEDAKSAICSGDEAHLKELVDYGYVKATEVAAMKRVLVRDDRSEIGKRYSEARARFEDMGLCSACADNVAQYYTRKPASACAKLAEFALRGEQSAIRQLAEFPPYCEWRY